MSRDNLNHRVPLSISATKSGLLRSWEGLTTLEGKRLRLQDFEEGKGSILRELKDYNTTSDGLEQMTPPLFIGYFHLLKWKFLGHYIFKAILDTSYEIFIYTWFHNNLDNSMDT